MKVLVITNLFPNKMQLTRGIFNKQQILELAKSCELKIVAPIPWHNFSKVPLREKIDGFDVYHPRYLLIPKIARSLYGFLFFLSLIGKIRRLYKEFKFDCIFATWAYPDAFGSYLIAKALNIPIVIKVHGSDINIYSKYLLRRKMIVWALNRSNKVISVSNALKNQMIKIGVLEEKILVIPNGIDANLFKPIDRQECRVKLKLPVDKKIFLFIGNLVPIKGVKILIEAFSKFAYLNPDTLLLIVGDGPLEVSLRRRVEELGDTEKVLFLERCSHDKVPIYMNACDIFCLPSLNEGCPNVIIESFACGIPVVASNVGGIPELIVDGQNGFLSLPDNFDDLYKTLMKTVFHVWDRNKIREQVAAYSWKRNAALLHIAILKTVSDN